MVLRVQYFRVFRHCPDNGERISEAMHQLEAIEHYSRPSYWDHKMLAINNKKSVWKQRAHRSSPPLREQRLLLNIAGNISIRRSHKYTVVPRLAASSSIAVPLLTKCVTSAIWTPTCNGYHELKENEDTLSCSVILRTVLQNSKAGFIWLMLWRLRLEAGKENNIYGANFPTNSIQQNSS